MNIENQPVNLNIGRESDFQFSDIFNLDEIQQIQDLFADSTGLASLITTPNGLPITKPSNFCKFCEIVRSTEKGFVNCCKSDGCICLKEDFSDELPLKSCLSGGLWDAGSKISVGGKHIANWLIGQVRDENSSESVIEDYAFEIEVDKDELVKAYREVPVMSATQFAKMQKMLIAFAAQLSEKAYSNFQLKGQLNEIEKINGLLHKSEESLEITLQSIGDAVISTDNNGLIVSMNSVAEKLCGCRLSNALGKPLAAIYNIMNCKTRIQINNPLTNVLEKGEVSALEDNAVLLSQDGSEYHISESAAPIKNKAGQISGVVLVFSDVTERFLAEERIRNSEERYRGLLNIIDAGVVVHLPDTSIDVCNPKACELLGLTESQLMGKTAIDEGWRFVDEYRRPLPLNCYPVNRIINTKQPLVDFLGGINHPKTNDIVWVVINGFPVTNSSGEIIEIVLSFIDITNRKNAENALFESEQYLIDTQHIARLGTYTMDIPSKTWTSSDLLNEIFGIDTSFQRTTDGWISIVHPEWQERILNYFLVDVIQLKRPFDKKYKIIRQNDQQERWLHGLGRLVFDENNNPIRMIGTIQDITETRNTELALAKSEQKYRSIFENVQDVFFQIDKRGFILEISPSVKFYPGFNRINLLGKSVLGFYASLLDRESLLREINMTGEIRDYELDLVPSEGIIKHVSINARTVFDDYENFLYIEGTIRDITKRKDAERALKQKETFLRETQFLAKLGTFNFDLINNRWESSDILDVMFGIYAGYNKTYSGWKSLVHPDYFGEVSEYFGWKLKENKALFDVKYKIIRNVDGQERWVHMLGRLFYNSENKLIRVIGTVQDITDRKNAKQALRDSQEQLKNFAAHLQSVREEERILLAREIHDELGQILIALKIDLGILKQNVVKTLNTTNAEAVLTKFDGLFGLVDTTINTTRKIMTDLRPEVLYLIGFVEAVKLQVKQFQDRYGIDCIFNSSISNLTLDTQQSVALFRILQESLTNVVKHSNATLVKIRFIEAADKLLFEVSDNGVGFDKAKQQKTDSYGLIGMRERVFLLDGELNIDTCVGVGTTVRVEMSVSKLNKEQNKMLTI